MILQSFLKIVIFLIFLKLTTTLALSTEPCRYTFGIVPTFHPEKTLEVWDPILKELGRRLNCQFTIKTFDTFGEFMKALNLEKIDFALSGPYQVVLAKRTKGYMPIIRDRDPIRIIVVVRKDSKYYSIFALDGRIIGFTDPNAYITTIYMQKKLREEFKINFTPKYLKTHDNVYRHVLLKLVDAGCAVDLTFKRQPLEVREQLHILFQSEPFPSPAIIVHPRVPKQIKKAFVINFLQIAKEDTYAQILQKTQVPNPISANYERDYKILETFALENSTSPLKR